MCLIIFNWDPKSQKPLVLAANRDEFHQRPSLDAHFWADYPTIFAGRDLEKKGTWLGVAKTNNTNTFRLAALTNFRSVDTTQYTHSRGEITQQFLASHQTASDYTKHINYQRYAGFNGLFFDGETLVYCHHQKGQEPDISILPAGSYGLSNAKLDSPWLKVKRAKAALNHINDHQTNEEMANLLLNHLGDKTIADDADLPNTGVGIQLERMLSPAFIISPNYGTRTSSVVILEHKRNNQMTAYFQEQQFSPDGKKSREQTVYLD